MLSKGPNVQKQTENLYLTFRETDQKVGRYDEPFFFF